MSWPSLSSPPVPCDGVKNLPASRVDTSTMASATSGSRNSSNTTSLRRRHTRAGATR